VRFAFSVYCLSGETISSAQCAPDDSDENVLKQDRVVASSVLDPFIFEALRQLKKYNWKDHRISKITLTFMLLSLRVSSSTI